MDRLEMVDSRLLTKKIREFTGKKSPAGSTIIKNGVDTTITDL